MDSVMSEGRKLNFPLSGRVWVFTGGAHAAGGFAENRSFRNSAGLFEEVVRWDMRGQEVAGRENFVFNTAGSGCDVRRILREFDRRVACYHPSFVVYISGEEDGRLSGRELREGREELRSRTEALGAEFIELPGGEDSLAEANRLLDLVGGNRSLVEPSGRNCLTLAPTDETFARCGKLKLSEKPMRWLFLGDSITHGAAFTGGYDSLPQLWEKYLREDWGRRDDTVLNTAVSGATAGECLERLAVRYTPYADADVVVAMFGTNDCRHPDTVDTEQFRAQLRAVIDLARTHGSQVVLRVPLPQRADAEGWARDFTPFALAARETALETGVLLVDHFRSFSLLQEENPACFDGLMGDAIHPNARGQYRMFREMAYAADMVLPDSMVSLDYLP